MIRNHKDYGIVINDCHIDTQNSLFSKKLNRLYAFCLCYDNTVLKVHQPEYAKLTQLFDMLGVVFESVNDYEYVPDETLIFEEKQFDKSFDIVNSFYDKWGLNRYVSNFNAPHTSAQDVYDSLIYYFPDFIFTPEMKGSTIGKKTIIRIIHKNSGRVYRMTLKMLKTHGDKYLSNWREKWKQKHLIKNIIKRG